jgi:hypothetical protein
MNNGGSSGTALAADMELVVAQDGIPMSFSFRTLVEVSDSTGLGKIAETARKECVRYAWREHLCLPRGFSKSMTTF